MRTLECMGKLVRIVSWALSPKHQAGRILGRAGEVDKRFSEVCT